MYNRIYNTRSIVSSLLQISQFYSSLTPYNGTLSATIDKDSSGWNWYMTLFDWKWIAGSFLKIFCLRHHFFKYFFIPFRRIAILIKEKYQRMPFPHMKCPTFQKVFYPLANPEKYSAICQINYPQNLLPIIHWLFWLLACCESVLPESFLLLFCHSK